jgi:hypothetical protein
MPKLTLYEKAMRLVDGLREDVKKLTVENLTLMGKVQQYYGAGNKQAAEIAELRGRLDAANAVCKSIDTYMRNGEFFDPETSKAIYAWRESETK